MRHLPSLTGLRVFEVAARHGSFKLAADELCVTQAAVSRQIRQLEEGFAVDLFLRGHRKVSLTPAGKKLYLSTHNAFADIAKTSQEIQSESLPNYLNLYATSSFSRLWLVPRLPQLRKLHPDIHLQLTSLEQNPNMADKFEAGITLGLEKSELYESDFLFSEVIFPVCTPQLLAENPDIVNLDCLIQHSLLELDSKFWQAKWWQPVDWATWLLQLDQSEQDEPKKALKGVTPDMMFSHFSMLLDAVLQGVGIGLGWQHLVQDMLDDGRLVRPVPDSFKAIERKHYFVCRKDLVDKPEMVHLRDWLLSQTAIFRH